MERERERGREKEEKRGEGENESRKGLISCDAIKFRILANGGG